MLVKGNKVSRKDIKNVLLIQLGDIGDVVLSFPCIRALKENLPDANIIVAVREKAKELIEDCPWAAEVLAINEEKRGLVEEIIYQKNFFFKFKKINFDLAIDLRSGTRGAILTLFSGARQRIGRYAYDGKLWRNHVFTHLVHPDLKPGQHIADYYLEILAAHNLKTKNIWPEIAIPIEKRQRAFELLKKEGAPTNRFLIAIQPFSLWPYKELTVDKYIALIKHIKSKHDFPIIITGSSGEKRRAEEIRKACGEGVFNFAGKTSLGMYAAILNACGLFIGTDSAGLHIAAAVGTSTVGIFGPSSFFAWAPRGKQHSIVHKDYKCVPCSQKGCNGKGISNCMKELTVQEISEKVVEQISRRR
jgi:ADP-heptose:LPS heptosyltransferase